VVLPAHTTEATRCIHQKRKQFEFAREMISVCSERGYFEFDNPFENFVVYLEAD
jgi:hypothetical protein